MRIDIVDLYIDALAHGRPGIAVGRWRCRTETDDTGSVAKLCVHDPAVRGWIRNLFRKKNCPAEPIDRGWSIGVAQEGKDGWFHGPSVAVPPCPGLGRNLPLVGEAALASNRC